MGAVDHGAEPPAAHLRIRVLGRFSPAPTGRRFFVSPASFAEVMERAGLNVSVTVADRLTGSGRRAFELSLPRLRAFQLGDVVGATPVLASLDALVRSLSGPEPPSADSVVCRVRELAGEGSLTTAVEAALAPTPSALAASTTIAAVARSLRSDGVPSGARAARRAIEEALFATAAEILKDDALAALESAWRGLKLLVDQCSSASEVALEVVDVTPAGIVEAMTAHLPDDAFDQPDLFVVVDPCDDVAVLERLADAAEASLAPVLVSVSPRLFGAEEASGVAAQLERDDGVPERWTELRANEATRWLSVVTNRAVVAAEGHGAARRHCLASGAFAVAAMLVKSFRGTGAFARVLGAPGALEAPATRALTTGRDEGTSIPTEAFYPIAVQERLASCGIAGLGSGRNSTKIVLSAAPTVRGSKDALPLPAQMWSGRIVRFAKWVRDQIPPASTSEAVSTLFQEAAEVFLFSRAREGAALRTGVGDADGARVVEVLASLGAELAGIPFQMAFTLPLRA